MTVIEQGVRELIRTRVRVERLEGDPLEGTLAALTPAGDLLVADPRGVETRIPLSDVSAIEDARFTCAQCGRQSNTTYAADRCADCYRDWCVRQPAPDEVCVEDDCDVKAFYSPKAKVFRCMAHHAKHNTLSGQSVELRVIQAGAKDFGAPDAADCRADDVSSARHDFKLMKSSSVCRKCQVKVFGNYA